MQNLKEYVNLRREASLTNKTKQTAHIQCENGEIRKDKITFEETFFLEEVENFWKNMRSVEKT